VPRQGEELGSDAFRLRFVRIDDDVLEMEAAYGGDGRLPPEHPCAPRRSSSSC
jgi:hypothetical protein